MWLFGNHRLTIASIIIITGIAGAWFLSAKNSQDPPAPSKQSDDFGTAQKAFDAASSAVWKHLAANELEPFVIDPAFRSTLLSKSKIWTVKGYARTITTNLTGGP